MTAEPAPRRPPSLVAVAIALPRLAGSPVRLWRRSMRVRTVLITVVLASLALVVVGSVVSYTIARGLFEERKDQVLAESARATAAAAAIGEGVTDSSGLNAARDAAVASISTAARPDGFVWTRSDQGGTVVSSLAASALVKQDLVHSLADSGSAQTWQSIAIPLDGGGVHPGIVVGNVLQFGQARSVLYLIFDIGDVQDTLVVVQRSLLIGGLALLLLIAAVVTVVSGLITAPLKQVAATSEQLAAGHLEQRIPERGEDAVAVVARSFNRMAEGLQRQITQLANLSRVQQRFVSDVSHELRTPLTTIRLAADVLYDSRDRSDPPTARSAELLRTQVQRFEALLADLLEISRMDAQAAVLSAEPVGLVDIARETIDALGGLAEETGCEVRLVAPGGHVLVDADGRRIARVVRNLLANALEHGERRPVVVTVDSSERAVALGVRDHGIGMTEEDAARVFDRFWRADPSRQRRVGGTGLGLAISLEDAVLHGGVLEVWSRKEEGTNFVLTLPRTAGDDLDRPVPVRPLDVGADGRVRRGERVRVKAGA